MMARKTGKQPIDEKVKETLELVIFHCEMFLYGFQGPMDAILNPVAQKYNQFAGLHLISTMFLVRDRDDPQPMGGFCYRVLDPLGLAHLLKPIQRIVQTPTGKTTFGDFIRLSRNMLATHGDLSFGQMPDSTASLPYDDKAVSEFQELMLELAEEVERLKSSLEKVLEQDHL